MPEALILIVAGSVAIVLIWRSLRQDAKWTEDAARKRAAFDLALERRKVAEQLQREEYDKAYREERDRLVAEEAERRRQVH